MAIGKEQFIQLIKSLLPQGHIWEAQKGSLFHKIICAMAVEFTRVELRKQALFKELNPTSTSEMIPEWEKLLGIPNKATGPISQLTYQARKKFIFTFYTMTGGSRAEYYKRVIKSFGFDVEIKEIKNFRVGLSRVGDPLTNGNWRNAIEVRASNVPEFKFRVGQSAVGDPLVVRSNELIKNIMEEIKPAHVVCIYTFG